MTRKRLRATSRAKLRMRKVPSRPRARQPKTLQRAPLPLAGLEPEGSEAQILAAASKATAQAHDELFELKHAFAQVRETVRAELSEDMQRLRNQFEALQAERANPPAELEALRWQLAEERRLHLEQRERADHFEGRSKALESSTSWRLTAPLRVIIRAVRR